MSARSAHNVSPVKGHSLFIKELHSALRSFRLHSSADDGGENVPSDIVTIRCSFFASTPTISFHLSWLDPTFSRTMELLSRTTEENPILNLSRLQLSDLNLEHISDSKRKRIEQLQLAYNGLTVFPTSICLLSNLEYLDISNNALTAVPEEILQLTKLKTLVAKNNHLDETSFPKCFGSMPIESLNFSGNRFTEIPAQFLQLVNLQSLSVGGNRLKSIPAELGNLTRQVLLI